MKRFLLGALLLAAAAQPLSAQTLLRQSTERTVRMCGAVAVGDGFTPVTSLALSTADEAEALREGTATLDISGATWAAVTGADGCYDLTLTTTATNTIGALKIIVQDDSLVLPMQQTFQVVEEAVFDACCVADAAPLSAGDVVDEWETQSQADPTGFHVNVLEVGGTAQTANDIGGDTNEILLDTAVLGALPTEPSDVPSWGSATVAEWVGYIGAWFRNEVQQTASTKTLRNDADTAALITCGVSDNGTTFQVDECAAAP